MKITVNKCPKTGILFEDDREYRRHQEILRAREKAGMKAKLSDEQLARLQDQLFDMPDIETINGWLNANYWTYAGHHGFRCNWWRDQYVKSRYGEFSKPTADDEVIINLSGLQFKEDLPTTHAAPRGQPTTGWSGGRDHYKELGWEGRIGITFKGKGYDFFDYRQLELMCIHVGSGGGSAKSLRYDVKLFAKDFQAMRRMEVLRKLAR